MMGHTRRLANDAVMRALKLQERLVYRQPARRGAALHLVEEPPPSQR